MVSTILLPQWRECRRREGNVHEDGLQFLDTSLVDIVKVLSVDCDP